MMKRVIELAISGGVIVAGIACASGMASGSETINYSYDAKGRLIQVRHSGTVNNNVLTNYSFDHADNRRTMNVTGAP